MNTQAMTKIIADYFKTQPVLKEWLFGSFAVPSKIIKKIDFK